VAERVDIRMNGQTVQTEEYSDVRTDLEIPETAYDPATWSAPKP